MPEHSRRSMEQYYAEFPEDDRLKSGFGQLEFERTKTIVQRFLPLPPAVVADVGGGTGPYSFWLASLGYEVHLIDRLLDLCSLQNPNAGQSIRRRATHGGSGRCSFVVAW
jgi:2-polyprenyl-3-methyl-5-hydroxy-6-metoxy-1,4-benzoquinol methylase